MNAALALADSFVPALEVAERPSTVVPKMKRRTRRDPLEFVWESHIVPKLEATKGRVEATTLLESLVEEAGHVIDRRHLRTLQRRIRAWRDAQRVLEPARRVERMRQSFDRVGLTSVARALDGVEAIEADALLALIEGGLDAEAPLTARSS